MHLLVPTRKNKFHLASTVTGVIAILGIIYFYANTFAHYGLGILGAAIVGLYYFTPGITSKGFSYNRSYVGFLASWDKIKEVRVKVDTVAVKVSFFGEGHYDLYFDRGKYEKLIEILKENLLSGVLKIT